ncbi:MAG: PAS domain S-box protein [Anaerolineae bacterium]
MANPDFKSFPTKIGHLWDYLTEPYAGVTDLNLRQKSRILSSLTLIILMTLAALILIFLLDVVYVASPGIWTTAFVLMFITAVGAYQLSRGGRVQIASTVVLGMGVPGTLIPAILVGGISGYTGLFYMLITTIFASVFLSLRGTITVIVVQLIFMVVAAPFISGMDVEAIVAGPFTFNVLVASLMLMVTYYRQQLVNQRQAELSASEERYRIISELISDYAYSMRVEVDGSMYYEWITDEPLKRLTGFTIEELDVNHDKKLGQGLFHPDDVVAVRNELAHALKGEATRAEHRIITKTGEVRWVRMFRRPYWDPQQERVTHLYGVAQDITARKQAEISLKESEVRFRLITEASSDLISLYDGNGQVQYISPSLERVMGYSLDELHANPSMGRVHPEDMAKVFAGRSQAMEGVSVQGAEYRLRNRAGEYIWLETNSNPILGDDGKVKQIVVSSRDVTARKATELALKLSENRYRIITELISDYAYFYRLYPDGSRSREWITDSFTRITGYTPEELKWEDIGKLIHPDDLTQVNTDRRRVEQGESVDGEHRIVTKSGEIRWLAIHRRPEWDENHTHVIGYYGVAQDITARKLAEITVKESEERFRLITEATSDYISLYDGEGHVQYISPSLEQTLGISLQDLQRDTSMIKIHPDDANSAGLGWNQVMQGVAVHGMEYRLLSRDGDYIWFETNSNPIRDDDGKIRRIVVSSRDATTRKKAQIALKASEERYRIITELISDYAFYCRVEPDGTRVREWITDSFVRVTGYLPEEVVQPTGDDIIHPDFRERAEADRHRVEQGESVQSEYLIHTKSGELRWLGMYRRPEWDEQHMCVIGYYGVAQDITARKEVELALKASEERYRIISELMSDYAYSLTILADGTPVHDWITEASFVRATGYTHQELDEGDKVNLRLFHPDEELKLQNIFEELLHNRSSISEHRIITKSGDVRWLRLSRRPHWDEQEQRVTRVYGVAQDITARKQAELALMESEARYRLITELTSDYAYYYELHADGSRTQKWVTESVVRVTGYTPDELISGAQRTMFHPDDYRKAAEERKQILLGENVSGEYRMITKDGEHRWLNIHRRPDWNENHTRIIGYYGVAQDITARKQAELALKTSEERYRIVSELISDYAYYYKLNPDGSRVREWTTDSFTRLTGYPINSFPDNEVSDIYHPDDQQAALLARDKLLSGEQTHGEYRIITRSGELRWLNIRRTPQWDDEHKQIVGYYGVAQDVTARKVAEIALRKSEERYRIISELISDYAYYFRVDPDGTREREWVTDSMVNVTGYTPDELPAGMESKMFHRDDFHRSAEDRNRIINGESVSNEYRIVTKNGDMKWLNIRRRPVWDDDHTRVVGYYGVAQDITARKLAENQRLQITLEQEQRIMVNKFKHALSHDFRTMLATIETSRYLVERILEETTRQKVQKKLDVIRQSVNHLASQLDNLQMVSSLTEPPPNALRPLIGLLKML